jgi:alkanesulfonate monooxygenase SsuD/methylene tetrahydromethanopterin reductase-like flavin-dependent oxidoreductase (luciferase family)
VTAQAAYYGRWGMQESSTVDMVLDPERDPRDWAIVGTPDDCAEMITQYKEELGIQFMGLSLANLPKAHSARLEFLQYLSEEVLSKVR